MKRVVYSGVCVDRIRKSPGPPNPNEVMLRVKP